MLAVFDDGEFLRRKEISQKASLSLSVLSETLPITKRLGLLGKRLGNHKYFLTPLGKEIIEDIKKEEEEKLAPLGRELIKKSKVLEEGYKILTEKENLTYDELGLRLAEKFGKKWNHPFTYRAVGRSCVDILSSFHLIKKDVRRDKEGKEGRARRGYFGKQRHENVLIPTAGTAFIFSTLKTLRKDGGNDISLLLNTQRKKENFKSLVDLGIVEHVGENKFELTEVGKQLKNAIGTNRENKVFRTILLKYPPVLGTINVLKEGEEEFSILDLANAIKKYNNSDWTNETGRSYAYKFLSWLKKADVIENGNYGHYRLTNDYDQLGLNEKVGVIEEMETSEGIEQELENNEADMVFPTNEGYVKVENIERVRDVIISKSLRVSKITEASELKGKTFKAEITIKDTVMLIKLLRE